MNRNTFSRAEQREKGITNMVRILKPLERITRVPRIAGTLQPNPINESTKERPSMPSRSISASIRKAARER